MYQYLILGTGTDIGKSFLVENFCRIFRKKKLAINAIKPIASGFLDHDLNSDSARILRALGEEISLENINNITPWRFEDAVSPHFAAKNCGKEINFFEVVDFCQKMIYASKNKGECLLIESAGGAMTPINDTKTFLDLAKELKIPILLVTANYLGSISHTLCTITALEKHKINIKTIIVNQHLTEKNSLTSNSDFTKTIQGFSGIDTILMSEFLEKISA